MTDPKLAEAVARLRHAFPRGEPELPLRLLGDGEVFLADLRLVLDALAEREAAPPCHACGATMRPARVSEWRCECGATSGTGPQVASGICSHCDGTGRVVSLGGVLVPEPKEKT